MHVYVFLLQRILDGLGLVALGPTRLSSAVDWTTESAARPIFWANQAATNRVRGTADEFPNGRFTLSSSPAFGELSDYYLSAKRPKLGDCSA